MLFYRIFNTHFIRLRKFPDKTKTFWQMVILVSFSLIVYVRV